MDTTTTPTVQEIQRKQHFKGKVIRTTIAGAIVDIGLELPGVVHISHLRKEPVNRTEDVVNVGDEVDVWVRQVKKDRIELTMIEPLALEWREIKPDMVVKGKVVRIEPYGAFIDIGAERPGMVHVSEIAHEYVRTPDEKLKIGDEVEAKVLEANRRKKQIRLSIKALLPEPVREERPSPAQVDSAAFAGDGVALPSKPRRRGKKGAGKDRRAKSFNVSEFVEEEKEPELTAMQIAWQQALERAKARKNGN
jgi:ribosomal protein S1